LIDQAKQLIEWNQARDGDIAHLARVCREFGAMVTNVNENAAPAQNLMNEIAGLYVVGLALRDVQCPAGAAVVRNALEFARQNSKTEADVQDFPLANNRDQIRVLTESVPRRAILKRWTEPLIYCAKPLPALISSLACRIRNKLH
jgi:hypothetical protein